MLRQVDSSNQDKTIEEILLESCPDRDTYSKERFDYEMEYDRLFTGFGFEKKKKPYTRQFFWRRTDEDFSDKAAFKEA